MTEGDCLREEKRITKWEPKVRQVCCVLSVVGCNYLIGGLFLVLITGRFP